jgi:hypothetical protein
VSAESREARKAKLAADAAAQEELDLEAIDALEIQLGDSNVATVKVAYTPGMPVVMAVRCPTPVEIKRFRDTVKPRKDGKIGDAVAAAEALADVCRVYPSDELYAAVCEARAGAKVAMGSAAVNLASGAATDAGKD